MQFQGPSQQLELEKEYRFFELIYQTYDALKPNDTDDKNQVAPDSFYYDHRIIAGKELPAKLSRGKQSDSYKPR